MEFGLFETEIFMTHPVRKIFDVIYTMFPKTFPQHKYYRFICVNPKNHQYVSIQYMLILVKAWSDLTRIKRNKLVYSTTQFDRPLHYYTGEHL